MNSWYSASEMTSLIECFVRKNLTILYCIVSYNIVWYSIIQYSIVRFFLTTHPIKDLISDDEYQEFMKRVCEQLGPAAEDQQDQARRMLS